MHQRLVLKSRQRLLTKFAETLGKFKNLYRHLAKSSRSPIRLMHLPPKMDKVEEELPSNLTNN